MTDIQKQHQTEAESLQETLDSYASHIRTATDGGDAIVDCLIRIMEDDSVGAKPHERLDAQLLLDSIGFGRLAAQEATRPRPSPETNVAPGPPSAARSPSTAGIRRPRRPTVVLSAENLVHLPPLVWHKTDNGRTMSEFLTSVVKGEFEDFRPIHHIRAAKQLAARGFNRAQDTSADLPDLSIDDTLTLIQTLTTAIEERKARKADASTDEVSASDASQGRADADDDDKYLTELLEGIPEDIEYLTAAEAQVADPRLTVLDSDYAPACPNDTHLPGCDCVARADHRRHRPRPPTPPPRQSPLTEGRSFILYRLPASRSASLPLPPGLRGTTGDLGAPSYPRVFRLSEKQALKPDN